MVYLFFIAYCMGVSCGILQHFKCGNIRNRIMFQVFSGLLKSMIYCQTCRSQRCFIGIFLVRLLLFCLPQFRPIKFRLPLFRLIQFCLLLFRLIQFCLLLFRLIQFRLPVFRLLHKYWKFQVCCHTHKWQMCTWTGLSTNILIC